jgi:predicted deacylase
MLTNQAHPLRLGGSSYAHGKHLWKLPITTDLNGGDIDLYNHVIVGSKPGPTLTLTSTLHGVEWLSIEMLKRVVERLDPDQLTGAVIAIPVANPSALGNMSRTTPDDSDNADLNRTFPGRHTWITEQLAQAIVREVLPHTSAVIDFHLGIWGSSFGYVAYGIDFPDEKTNDASKRMALAFGVPILQAAKFIANFPGPRSLAGYAGAQLGIPSCIGELGGAGFGHQTEEEWIETCVTGIFNVLKEFGMYAGAKPSRPPRYLSFEAAHRVNPSKGGLLYPVNRDETFGREVREGELLATVVSPYTFAVMEELRSPCDGYISYFARWYPVRPGDWAFGVIPKDSPGTKWVDSHGM